MNWKVVAIIFIGLFIVENLIIVWGFVLAHNEEKQTNICYYDICSEYPEADFTNELCSCYDYDVLGKLTIVKQKYLG